MRREGWELILRDHIRNAYRQPFVWGTRDCALWAASWVRDATGNDFLSDWLKKYTTEAGAARLMKKRGFATVADIASAHLPEISPKLAKRGDLLVQPITGALGICYGRHGFFLLAEGVTMVDTTTCPRAWAVG